jgi:ElaB/YqjD/DUF883 family membrane-anchored ribosome-binding protein
MSKQDKTVPPVPETPPGKFSAGVDRMAAGAHSGIDAAAEASGPAMARATSTAHKAVDQMDGAATHAAEAAEAAGARGTELISAGRAYVHEHPVAALGIAVAAGYLLSRVLGSR